MLDRLNLEFQDVPPRDWRLLISLLVMANLVTLTSFGWIVLSRASIPYGVRGRVMAQSLATRTPWPTFTPTIPVTPSPTYTRIPTWTPFYTVTPTPSITPTPTETPQPPTPKRIAMEAPRPPTSTPTPTPAHDFIASVRQLSPCENEGKHHIFIHVRDKEGQGIPGVRVHITWPGGETYATTGRKLEVHPGFVDFAMFKGSYTLQLADLDSEVVGPLTPDIARSEMCNKTGNPVANSMYHYSYEVVFQQVR
ncbi:MAG: hypothetical protein ACUVSF_05500 [Anaerolineae bacterium]